MARKEKRHANCAAADTAWEARCKVLHNWVQSKGRLPVRHAETTRESAIAAWVSSCQQKHRTGWLTAAQLRALRSVPFMKARTRAWGSAEAVDPATRFNVRVQVLQKWVKVHGGALPKRKAKCVDEKGLAAWLGYLQQKWHSPGVYGAIPDDKLALLRKVRGMTGRIAQWSGVLTKTDAANGPSKIKASKGGGLAAASTLKRKPASQVVGASTSSASKRRRSSQGIAGDAAPLDQHRLAASLLKRAGILVKRKPAASSSAEEPPSDACASSGQLSAKAVDGEGIDNKYEVGSRVSVWSTAKGKHVGKWFDDGRVTKVSPSGVEVLFSGLSLEKEVPWSFAPSLLKLHKESRSYVVGDTVSVWSVQRKQWIHDGVVTAVGLTDIKVVSDGGQMESSVPLHLTGEFVLPHNDDTGEKGPEPCCPAKVPVLKAACPKRRLQEANTLWQEAYGSATQDGTASSPAVTFAD